MRYRRNATVMSVGHRVGSCPDSVEVPMVLRTLAWVSEDLDSTSSSFGT